MAKDVSKQQLASLSREEKQQLLQSFEGAQKFAKNTMSLEEKASALSSRRTKQVGLSPNGEQQFNAVLEKLFPKKASYSFVPLWLTEIAYEWLQELDNPWSKPWSKHEVRAYIRVWCFKNGNRWREYSPAIGKRQYAPYRGKSRLMNGFGKNKTFTIDVDEDTFPAGCVGIHKGGPKYFNRVKDYLRDYGREQLKTIFEETGITHEEEDFE